jgi:hypothetical protein
MKLFDSEVSVSWTWLSVKYPVSQYINQVLVIAR